MNTPFPTDILRAIAWRVLTENERRVLRRFLEQLWGSDLTDLQSVGWTAPR
jgi:hypothetical protein